MATVFGTQMMRHLMRKGDGATTQRLYACIYTRAHMCTVSPSFRNLNAHAKSHDKNTYRTMHVFDVSVIIVHNPAPILIRLRDVILRTQIIFLRLALRIEVRPFSPDSHTHSMSSMWCEAIRRRVVLFIHISITIGYKIKRSNLR